MKATLFALILAAGCIRAAAQSVPAARPQSRELFESAERERARRSEGRMLPEFSGRQLNAGGMPFSLDRLRQRISLICFWYPSCNCLNAAPLDSFTRAVRDPRFQVVSVMPDSFNYTVFIKDHPVPGAHVKLDSYASISELNFVGGYPAIMLVDGEGKVLRIARYYRSGAFDFADWMASINEALMR